MYVVQGKHVFETESFQFTFPRKVLAISTHSTITEPDQRRLGNLMMIRIISAHLSMMQITVFYHIIFDKCSRLFIRKGNMFNAYVA